MPFRSRYHAWIAVLLMGAFSFTGGCARNQTVTKARCTAHALADGEAYQLIAEKDCDPRWHAPKYNIDLDPRSRYFDPYNASRTPMPGDDPDSHRYLHCVDGKRGWDYWHANGDRPELENPSWREALAQYVSLDDEGAVKLDIDSAVRLAYVHSPLHQTQLETVYLTALDVSAERFFLDTQYFGGYDAQYAHNGRLAPAQIVYDGGLGRYIVTPPVVGVGSNRITLGRPSPGNPMLQTQRSFATAGQLLIGFANSFVFEFTGSDASLSSSLLNYSFIQPLLRGAGRDIALEQLTQDERNLLAALRAYGQFRQGFYTQVAIGELGVQGPTRFGSGTTLQSFGGQGGVGGYLGLLQQLQQIRNSVSNLDLQSRTLDRLEALLDEDFIDLVQVDQFRQSIQAERASLLQRRNSLELSLDRYKTTTLGLPPDLLVEVDDSLIQKFQLVPNEAVAVQTATVALQKKVGDLPDVPTLAQLDEAINEAADLVEPLRSVFTNVLDDLERLDEISPNRLGDMTPKEQDTFKSDREKMNRLLDELEADFSDLTLMLGMLKGGLAEDNRAVSLGKLAAWTAKFLRVSERVVLVPARARLESIIVESIELEPANAFQIALQNRLDFMNGRAALVDRWRQIQVNADALQSVLNITSSGDVRTAGNNPLDFRLPTGSFRMGVQFDAPWTRLLERNAYRESLIQYQRDRRSFIQSRDALNLGIRALLRQIEQLRQNLEIQRRAVNIAIRRVDQTQLSLNPPRAAIQPGQRPPINPTTAINLLSAQQSLRDTQNSLLGVWLDYYATRLRLYRELGIMVIDPDGEWIEHPLPSNDSDPSDVPLYERDEGPTLEEIETPPVIPVSWIEMASALPSRAAPPATRLERLPAVSQ